MEVSTKQAALEAVQRGLSVFPIKANAKSPPLVPRFQDNAVHSKQGVHDTWTRYPRANVGVHCEDLLVVDVDTAKGGLKSLKAVLQEQGVKLPRTLEVRTPSGGRHLYYWCNGGVRNRVNLWPGVDIRSNNGYVVAPGSRIEAGEYTISTEAEIVDAPDWLVEAVEAGRAEVPTEAPEDVNPDIAFERARDWLTKAQPAIEGQGGDHRTFKTIARIRDIGVPEELAVECLMDWNERCEPPWDLSELAVKVRNAYRYAENPPGTQSAEAWFDTVEPAEPQDEAQNDAESALEQPDDVDLASILASDYLVKKWLERGSQALLFGPWGAGKTFVALDLAAHLAAGHEWFGFRVRQGGVLYLGYEGHRGLRKRLYALRHENPKWDLSQFLVQHMDYPLVHRGDGSAGTPGRKVVNAALKSYLNRVGSYPKLVIIDPLRDALGGSDSDPERTAPYLGYVKRLASKTGACVLTVHHPGHSDFERSRGDSGIEAAMDTVIRVDDDLGVIETRKQRDEADSRVYYKLDVISLGHDQDGDEQTTCVVRSVDRSPLDPQLTTAQRRVKDALAESAIEGKVTKQLYNDLTSNLNPHARGEIWATLVQKRYIVPDGRSWLIHKEPVAGDIFDTDED